jgi:hypothetical protein
MSGKGDVVADERLDGGDVAENLIRTEREVQVGTGLARGFDLGHEVVAGGAFTDEGADQRGARSDLWGLAGVEVGVGGVLHLRMMRMIVAMLVPDSLKVPAGTCSIA